MVVNGGTVVVNRENGVAHAFIAKTAWKGGNGFGGNMKPIDALRHKNGPNVFNTSDYQIGASDLASDKGNGHRKEPKVSKMTKLAKEYKVPAVRLHVGRINPSRVAECCEKVATVLFAYAKAGELPKIYKTWQQHRNSAGSMGPEAIFAYLESAHKNPNERVDIFTIAAAATVGKGLAMTPAGQEVCGKTPQEWSDIVKSLAVRFADNVEAEYSRIKEQKAEEWKRMKEA